MEKWRLKFLAKIEHCSSKFLMLVCLGLSNNALSFFFLLDFALFSKYNLCKKCLFVECETKEKF